MYSGKKAQHDFPKMRGGRGIKGRLELFQKFIDNGTDRRPLVLDNNNNNKKNKKQRNEQHTQLTRL